MEDEFIKDVKKIKLLLIATGVLLTLETAFALLFALALKM